MKFDYVLNKHPLVMLIITSIALTFIAYGMGYLVLDYLFIDPYVVKQYSEGFAGACGLATFIYLIYRILKS